MAESASTRMKRVQVSTSTWRTDEEAACAAALEPRHPRLQPVKRQGAAAETPPNSIHSRSTMRSLRPSSRFNAAGRVCNGSSVSSAPTSAASIEAETVFMRASGSGPETYGSSRETFE